MISVDIRQLSERVLDLVRRVQEQGEEVVIRADGVAVARLLPIVTEEPHSGDALWTSIEALAAEIGAEWPEDIDAVAALREDRGAR